MLRYGHVLPSGLSRLSSPYLATAPAGGSPSPFSHDRLVQPSSSLAPGCQSLSSCVERSAPAWNCLARSHRATKPLAAALHLSRSGELGSCLQVTFQARDIQESRHLYDQLAVLTPIMLALSAATPVLKGCLADTGSSPPPPSSPTPQQLPAATTATTARFVPSCAISSSAPLAAKSRGSGRCSLGHNRSQCG